jgi:outer membrane protein assembly factor BamD (BamD/ComL family)
MTISAISSASSNPFYAKQTSTQQSFSTLVSALQSGDLSAAQSAYASFTQTAGQGDPNSPFAQAINQIGQDLQSGNIGAAQQTLSSLQQAHSAHRHHHHHGGGTPPQASSSTPDDPTSLSAALTLSSSNIVDVSA